jgi:hypothetical protein
MESVSSVYTQSISKAHLLNVAKMWLYKYDFAFYTQNSITAMDTRLASFFDILFCILDNYKFPASMIIPSLMYADKFAAKQGIKHDQLFYLMLSSVMVCIKFWDDTTSMKNAAIAQAFNYSLKSVNSIERNFLKGLDYNLHLTNADIIKYIESITASSLSSPSPTSSSYPKSSPFAVPPTTPTGPPPNPSSISSSSAAMTA